MRGMIDAVQVPPALRRLLIFSMAISLVACGRFGGPSLQEAQQTLASGDVGMAAIQLQNLLEKSPDSAAARLLFARVLLLEGDLESASRALAQARQHGAPVTDADLLESRLLLEQLRFDELLKKIDSGAFIPDPLQRSISRARALTGLGRVPEALGILEKLNSPDPNRALVEVSISQAHAVFGRWPLAAQHAAGARESGPDFAHAWLQSGLLALRQGNTKEAVDFFQRAIDQAHDNLTLAERSVALNVIAEIALKQGEIGKARSAHEQLVKQLPQAPATELLGARIELAAADRAAAITRLEALIRNQPELSSARVLLASALLADGRSERALQELSNLRSQDVVPPGVGDAQAAIRTASGTSGAARTLALAQAQILLGQPQAARQLLEQAIGVEDSQQPLEVALVQILLREGENEAALRRATDLVRRAPKNAAAQTVLGQTQLALRDATAAAASLERAWRLQPTSSAAVSLALARQQAGQTDALAPLLERLSREPKDISALLVLADLQSRRGMDTAAMGSYQAVLSTQPRNPVALNNLAGLYQRRRDPRALETARAAVDVLPERAETNDTLGWILVGAGQASEAVSLLEKAVRLDPTRPAIRYHLAAALANRQESADSSHARLWLADALRDPAQFDGRADAERLLETMSQTPGS